MRAMILALIIALLPYQIKLNYMNDTKIICSTKDCNEEAFVSLCSKHYNEIIQKNIEEEKVHEDHIMEKIA